MHGANKQGVCMHGTNKQKQGVWNTHTRSARGQTNKQGVCMHGTNKQTPFTWFKGATWMGIKGAPSEWFKGATWMEIPPRGVGNPTQTCFFLTQARPHWNVGPPLD